MALAPGAWHISYHNNPSVWPWVDELKVLGPNSKSLSIKSQTQKLESPTAACVVSPDFPGRLPRMPWEVEVGKDRGTVALPVE